MFHPFRRERYYLTPGVEQITAPQFDRLTRYRVYQENRYAAILGDQDGAPVFCDLTTAPHLLVAGTTGSGKSVSLNAMICSLLLKNSPGRLGLYLIDPKMVELARYRGLPHLMAPIATSVDAAERVLQAAHGEMMARYDAMSRRRALHADQIGYRHIVIVWDEFASWMADKAVRKRLLPYVQDLSRLGRAAGVHLILATQRPTRDVIDGQIKANCPARICFRVLSATDSRVILDAKGGERLRGRGEGLFRTAEGDLLQFQGCYCSDRQVETLVDYWARECRVKRYRQP